MKGIDKAEKSTSRRDTSALLLVIAALALCVVFCVSVDDTYDSSAADSGTDGGIDWKYDSTTNTLTISAAENPQSGLQKGEMKDYDRFTPAPWKASVAADSKLVIKADVKKIGNYAFLNCSGLTGVLTIPDSVTSIGGSAFIGTGFTGNLTISNGVTEIGSRAFDSCKGFNGTLTIGSGVREIGSEAFAGCSGFTGTLAISGNVTKIGDRAFRGCSGFTGTLTLPESVKSIGNKAFMGCTNITDASIPMNTSEVSEGMFKDCTSLKSVQLPDGLFRIDADAFSGCTSLKEISFVQNLGIIGDNAFKGCTSLEYAIIPENVSVIGVEAFSGCTKLDLVYIPGMLTDIGDKAFCDCPNIKVFAFGELSEDTNVGDLVFSNDKSNIEFKIGDSKVPFIQDNVVKFSNKAFEKEGETPVEKTLVVLDANGGTCKDQYITVTVGEPIGDLPTPTRTDHYTFNGWTDAAGYPVTKDTVFNSPAKITAQWVIETHTVTFSTDRGTAPDKQTVNYGAMATKPTDPTAVGSIFDGWYNGDTKWDFENNAVTGDIILTAKWTPEPSPFNDENSVWILAGVIVAILILAGALYYVKKHRHRKHFTEGHRPSYVCKPYFTKP